ncbi:uncharacterized protein BDZ99DRAFT_413339 [Mytilinidion resinicola]|uniref:AAA+ ATPase domain-containing protein n=1 Tax=Mytilinidion resinicola TaxID=574789 RepID=A0A6A6YVY3_9PEZI|nr:uncharacterized protein BDZ99DRAFT_413339 [Mytilinidion resinicola]KAF2812543.1 hypothetical protein BDZ99DRAFT_413339 [Mytilinidion resinicola]
MGKVSVLRESMIKTSTMLRTRLGGSSNVMFESSQTAEDFMEALENERLRHMPHDGSKWDAVLRWAESIGGHVLVFHEAVQDFMMQSEDATRLIWGSCSRLDGAGFDEQFGESISAFYHHLHLISDSMWKDEIAGSRFRHSNLSIETLREFLKPQDRVVQMMLSNQTSSGVERAEFTCEWFGGHLRSFTRNKNKVLLVTGAPCSGKTVLSHWISDSLQGSLDNDPYDVISYFVDSSANHITSPLSLVKSLVLQMLDRKIGDQEFIFKVRDALDHAKRGTPASTIEETLWSALDLALDNDKIIILIDGLDQISGARIGNPAILERIHRITSAKDRTRVKSIILSRPLSKAASQLTQHISIEEQHIADDIRLFIEQCITSRPQFRSMKEKDRRPIIQKLSEGSNGSFLWASLVFQSIKHEKTISSILSLLERAPKTVDEALDRQIARLDAANPETKQILSWILASERPLTTEEVQALLEIDLDQCSHSPRFTEIAQDIRHACGPLVTIRDGLVLLRHPSIREHVLTSASISNKIDLKEAHHDLTIRSLAYAKIHLHDDVEPRFGRMTTSEIVEIFFKYPLLEYSARYWTSHFRSSSLYESNGKHKLSSSFKACLSGSTYFALVEGTCVYRQHIACESEKYQSLSYHLRRTVFGERSAVVLQSLILQVRICQGLEKSQISEYSYEAWKISRAICHGSIVIRACAEAFVQCTLSIKITTRSEICIRKEEILLYLVETYKHTYGASHELTIKYTTMLAEFYVSIKEIDRAVVLYRELYEIRIEIYGHFHAETTEIFDILISQLRVLKKFEVILELTVQYYEYVSRTLTITDSRRIECTLKLIRMYEERKEVSKAEEILVTFWRSITTETSTSVTSRETKIDISLEYSRFLCRHSRKEESEVILRGAWTEVESYSEEVRSETTIIKRIRIIAEEFKVLKVFSMARSIFSSLWSYYKRTEQQTCTEAVSVATSLAETVTETISSSTSSTSTKHTLLEVFESSMSSSSTSISSSTLKTCVALSSSYLKEERYSEACAIFVKTISHAWSSVESSESKTIEITESSEIIDVAMSLAECRFKMLHVEAAEIIYWNVFESLICSRKCHHDILIRNVKTIIKFFEKTYRYQKVLAIYDRLYVYLQGSVGKSHASTIEILYAYGAIAKRMCRRKEIEVAYFQIYSASSIEHGCLHADGVKAALLLCEIYEESQQWGSAQPVYACLWATFLKHGVTYHLGADFVEKIYSKYMHILEHRTKTEYTVIRELAIQYRKTCISFYGSYSELTVKSTIHLAEICERREEYHEESMSLYEEVIKHGEKITKSTFSSTSISSTSSTASTTSTTTVSKSTQSILQIVKQRLASLYSTKTTTVSKAVSLYREQFETCKTQYGYSSTETLTAMRQVVMSYKKQSTTESTILATSLLRTSVTEIFQHESHAERSIESAKTIAKVYIECGYKEHAIKVIQEMRTTIIEQVKSALTVSVERNSYAFLAAFAEIITQSSSFSSIIAELRTEILLYESYYRATRTQKEFFSIMESGCRLYFYLKESKREADVKIIEEELLEVFVKHLTVSHTIKKTIITKFFHICMEEVMHSHYELTVIERATEMVLEHTKHSRFQEAYDLAALIDRFIHLQGGFHTEQSIRVGFRLALCLTGRGTLRCADAKLNRTMLDLSRILLAEALQGSETVNLTFTDLPIDLLNDLVGLLGEQQNFEDLERILNGLWSSRIVQKTWSTNLVIWIGRRLVETRFCRNHNAEAIHLCKDIRYNLARVWGSLDPTTLQFTLLLSELYTATNQYKKAMALHDDVLGQIAYGDNEGLSVPDSASTAVRHAELLKRSFQREGKWDKGVSSYQDTFAQLDQKFRKEKTWVDTAPKAIDKWQPKVTDQMGMWTRPTGFEFKVEDVKLEKPVRKQQYLLRRTSSNWAVRDSHVNGNGTLNGNGNGTGQRVY